MISKPTFFSRARCVRVLVLAAILAIVTLRADAQSDPVITEFQARNTRTLPDEDGAFPGWIELHNPGTNAVNFDGWFLTDDSSQLAKWRLPATNLVGRGFLVVFASGKNRAVAAAPLHANFQLSDSGEYLALVQPDGVTVASAFAPTYPPQFADRSYGLGMRVVIESLPPLPPIDPGGLSPYLHLRADAGVTTNAANNVTQWLDQSANAHVFRANHPRTTANDPQRVGGPVPGTFAINFDGTDLIDSDAALQLFTQNNSALTVFTVLKPTSIPGTQRFVMTHSPGTGGDSFELGQDAGQVASPGAWAIHRGGGNATSTGGGALIANRYRVLTAEVLSGGDAGSNVRFQTNGVPVPNQVGNWLAAGSYNTGSDPLAIGARVDNKRNGFDTLTPNSPFVGDLAEIVLYRRSLTAEERQGVANFLLTKYGFTPPALIVGRPELLPGQTGYFVRPTPGAVNGTPVDGFVADTKFSVDRGFYSTPTEVTITCETPGAVIRYTTDSSEPTATTGTLYTGPVTVTGTIVLRAAAFKSGLMPSDIDTQTYIFLDGVLQQPAAPAGFPSSWVSIPVDYAMDPEVTTNAAYNSLMKPALLSVPTLSLVTAKSNLWDGANGIYSHPQSRGDAWERPVSLEYIDPATGENWQFDAGLRIHGGVSRGGSKQAFNVHFRALYGTPTLVFPLFPANPVSRFDSLTLRSQWNDGWNHPSDNNPTAVYVRDEWCRRTFTEMGQLASIGTSMHLYIDGLYWGLYNPVEHINAAFVAQHLGGREEDYDVVKFNGGPTIEDGDLAAWQTLMGRVAADVSQPGPYASVLEMLDVDDLIDFMILYIYIGNEDGPAKNYYAYRPRVPDGKWRFISWDNEWCLGHSFSGLDELNVNVSTADAADTATRLYNRLRLNAEFRVRFGDRVQKHFAHSGALGVGVNLNRYLALITGITNAIIGESARWGDLNNPANPGHPFTRNAEWATENRFMLGTYFLQRPAIVQKQFRALGLVPTLGAPVLSQNGGSVLEGYALTITHTNASGAILFTLDGSDPRLPGGAVSAAAQSYAEAIGITANMIVRARVGSGANWSALVEATFYPPQDLSALHLTEIMYAPPNSGLVDGDEFEFVELKNTGARPLGLDGFAFTSGIEFTFTNGTRLQPGQFLVLVRNPARFAARYPGVAFHGVYAGKLDNGGESIALSHPLGGRILGLTYDDAPPWPVTADGLGFSLVPAATEVAADLNRALHWRAGSAPGGSPGADDPEPTIPRVRINEVLTATDAPGGDFVELYNPTGATADIGGWWLTDDANEPLKFRIPAGTRIAPGGFVSFSEAQFDPAPGTPGSFSLNARGDDLHLFSADTQTNLTGYTHSLVFGPSARDVTFGRHAISTGEEYFPAQLANTRDAANAGPRIGPVVISEIQYHPDTGGDEFIELRNVTSNALPLFDPEATTNTWKLSGLNYTFPPGLTLPPNGYLLLVATNPAGFRTKYNVDAAVAILGPYVGLLQDSGERLELKRPDVPTTNGVNYITVDEVRYNDRVPWPAAADGSGPSLQRIVAATYGNEPIHWEAALPTPGAPFTPGDAPRIVTHPVGFTRVQYQSVELSVIATGAEPLFYQWRRNNTLLPGRTAPTLVLTNLQPGDAGDYKVDVFNTAGSVTSSNAALVVLIPAIITQPPLSRQVTSGGSVTFSVLATGNGPFLYQWRFNDRALIGETNSTLVISNVALVHEGLYQVLVTDAVGTAPSALARLTVLIRPVITEQPQNVTAVVGDTVNLRVAATGNPLPFGYRWRRNVTTLTNFLLLAKNSVLTLTNVQLTQAANYSVIVTNLAASGVVSSNAVLTVLADTDRDRIPDSWERTYGLNLNDPADGGLDSDGDTVNNRDEYISGTDPTDRLSYLKIETIGTAPGLTTLTFLATSNRTYSVLVRDGLDTGSWNVLAHLNARPTNGTATVSDALIPTGERYYRLVAPEQR